ncbi:hypothetical protein ACSBR2_041260 [Camellia fascicularis]
METSTLFLFFFFSSLTIFTYKASSVDICEPTSCAASEPVIRFPFRLKTGQPDSCGYPGFDLSCNNQTQTVLTLPHSGEFTVTHIDYLQQRISINDPNFCLPNRVQNLSLSHSPFKPAFLKNYTFLNCSAHNWSDYTMHRFEPVFCLSKNPNYTVMVIDTDSFSGQDVPAACLNMTSVSAPVAEFAAVYRDSVNPSGDLLLTWTSPMCWPCEAAGGSCGLMSDSGVEIGCSNLSESGLPRAAKYGIIIGIGIPGFVCLIGLSCYTCSRIKKYNQQRQIEAQLSNWTPQPMVIIMGLDRPTIESYPTTVLGESRRLPKPNDGTCPICLAEYQPKETLRTIPECNHYFHANCIDEWLRMNATCPLCRNSPGESSVATPHSSTSLSPSSMQSYSSTSLTSPLSSSPQS